MTQKRIQEEILRMPSILGAGGEISTIRLMSDGSVELYSKGRRGQGETVQVWSFLNDKWCLEVEKITA